MYPQVRLRRARNTQWMRDFLSETIVLPQHLIQPFFVIEGKNKREEVETMPGVARLSIDLLVEKTKEAAELGIRLIALFPVIDSSLKDDEGSEAFKEDNLICRAVKAIKAANIDIGVLCDVALDPYTLNRHDGIVRDGDVHNELTVEALQKQSLALAKAGADILAPSDMMDGRIGAIRESLDLEGYHNVSIASYSMKYNTNLYGPFRDAVKSVPTIGAKYLSKATYQADYRVGYKQAFREVEQDVAEGADMLIIKPAMFYLDVINNVSNYVNLPIIAYQVSGEYAMMKFGAQHGFLNWENTMMESLIALRRSGATAIFTYAAIEMAKFLKERV